MKVIVTDADYPDLDIERSVLGELGCEVVRARGCTPEEIVTAAADADALVYQWAAIPRQVLAALPRVGLVVRYGVGVDSVDLDAAREFGVWVANVPGYGTEEVAAHAFAGILACLRNLKPYDANLARGTSDYLAAGEVRRLSTLTLGCLGLGRIGGMLAVRAAPWFGHVLAHDPYAAAEQWPAGVEPVGLDELFRRSDVLSLHAPLTEQSRHLVDAARLEQLPDGAVLVNTSRGGLIDEVALHRALESGRLRAAAIDTWSREPVRPDHPLVNHPRVVATPHAAWYSRESEQEVRRRAAANVATWIRTGRPDHVVVPGTRHASPAVPGPWGPPAASNGLSERIHQPEPEEQTS